MLPRRNCQNAERHFTILISLCKEFGMVSHRRPRWCVATGSDDILSWTSAHFRKSGDWTVLPRAGMGRPHDAAPAHQHAAAHHSCFSSCSVQSSPPAYCCLIQQMTLLPLYLTWVSSIQMLIHVQPPTGSSTRPYINVIIHKYNTADMHFATWWSLVV